MPVDRTSKLIAIIDDDEAMQDSLRDLMEAAGLVARCFGSAEEFLDSDLHTRATCLIVDIRMPKMSGLQLQARLKEEECNPGHGVVTFGCLRHFFVSWIPVFNREGSEIDSLAPEFSTNHPDSGFVVIGDFGDY
jgi:CheY-like chemotaxis protein